MRRDSHLRRKRAITQCGTGNSRRSFQAVVNLVITALGAKTRSATFTTIPTTSTGWQGAL